MATYYARKNDNADSTDMWNTASDGSGSFLTWPPAADDILRANSFTVELNVDFTVSQINTLTNGGYFNLASGDRTITANVLAGTSGTTGAVHNADTGTLTINGNVTSGTGLNAWGIVNNTTGTIVVNGNVQAGNGNTAIGAVNNSTGTFTVNGNIAGGGASTTYGGFNVSTGQFTVNGNSTGGSGGSSIGVHNQTVNGKVTITGIVSGGVSPTGYGFRTSGAILLGLAQNTPPPKNTFTQQVIG